MAEKAKNNPVLTMIDSSRRRLKAPDTLKPEVRSIFQHIVDHSSPDHFRENEAHLLALYASALYLARHYCESIGAENDVGQNHKQYVENAKLALSLCTKLRLAPSTRFDGRAAERKASLPDYGKAPWERDSGDMAPWND
jgi:hypothetical protein